MAVKLRLKRMGKKQQPFYRIVAADSRFPRDGRFIETVGTYNPVRKETEINIDEEKALKWLNAGAQPTDTVRSIFVKEGIMKKFAESKTKKAPKAKKEVKEAAPKKTTTKTTTAKKTTTTKKTTTKAKKA